MRDRDADLRMLYQAYSSQIEFSKTQLWRVVEYGIWAIAGVMGLFNGFGSDSRLAICFPPVIIVILSICLYNMLKNWFSMRTARGEFKRIRYLLTPTFQQLIHYRKGYESLRYDAWIVIPLIFVLVAGSVFAYILQIRNMRLCSIAQFFSSWVFRISLGVICSLIILIICNIVQERRNRCSHQTVHLFDTFLDVS